MALAINPKDPQTFASACLDHTVKVWSLGNPVPNFSLEAHEKGVNYVDYYHGGDRPYMVTTGDDRYVFKHAKPGPHASDLSAALMY